MKKHSTYCVTAIIKVKAYSQDHAEDIVSSKLSAEEALSTYRLDEYLLISHKEKGGR